MMDQNGTSTFSPTLSNKKLFHWDLIFEESYTENSSDFKNYSTPATSSITNSSDVEYFSTTFYPEFLVYVYKRAHSELARLLAVQSDVEKG